MIAWRILLLIAFLFAVAAAAQDFPKLSGRVVDAANLLSPADEAALDGKLAALQQASSRQLVVATVPDLQGHPIEDYGYRLGRAWGIGQKEADNGVILLVAPNERKVRVEVGYGLEPIITDALSSLIIQNAILPRFRENDYPGGINAGADALIEQLRAPPEQAEARAIEASRAEESVQSSREGSSALPLIFWAIVLAFILLSLARGRRGGRRERRRSYGGSDLPIILWTIANEMSRSSGGRRSSGWGGGSWGGGGGGWGGGGGFSGGGGSFGGGGASGGW